MSVSIVGHKLHHSNENPIDSFLLQLCEKIGKPLYLMGITPNIITLFGIVLSFITFYFFIRKQYILSIVFLWLTYFSDCLDGYMARTYQQITNLGDYLDHFRDQFFVVTLVSLLCLHINSTCYKFLFMVIIIIYATLMLAHLGCQEKVTKYTDANDCLIILKKACLGNSPEKTIQYTKWFGCGTFMAVLSIFILLVQFSLI
jgi:phosphatidylglycerophosphate synthase